MVQVLFSNQSLPVDVGGDELGGRVCLDGIKVEEVVVAPLEGGDVPDIRRWIKSEG